MSKVAVVIPFYGGNDYLPQLLDSIFVAPIVHVLQVYIIDNSKEGQRVNTSFIQHANVHVIDAGEAIGYGKACNIGYQQCIADGQDVMVVVNQDGFFGDGSLGKLVDTLLCDGQYTVGVPLLTEYASNRVEPFFTHVYLTPMSELVSDLFSGSTKPYYPMRNLCGACFAIKLKNYKLSYLFDELYHMYFEDGDLYHRLTQMKQQVMMVPSALFHHNHTNTKDELQTIRSLSIKQTSKHIYSLKNTGSSFGKAFSGWVLLVFRNMIEHVLKLQFRQFTVDLIAASQALNKIPVIRKKRKLNLLTRTD